MDRNKAYEILGVNENASTPEIQSAYMRKKAEYGEMRFSAEGTGNEAVNKIEELDEAYQLILTEQAYTKYKKPDYTSADSQSSEPLVGEVVTPNTANEKQENDSKANTDFNDRFSEIEYLLKNDDVEKAQQLLDEISYRPAEWHYLQSIIYYKKNWFLESKKQLDLAVNMDPSNTKYKNALDKLVKIMANKKADPSQFSAESTVNSGDNNGAASMHNGTCTGSCCGDVCLANACCNCAQCFCR